MKTLFLKFKIISNQHFTQIYQINYAMLMLTTVIYFFYIYFINIKQGLNLKHILAISPYTSTMMVVVLLNTFIGYFLWIKKDLIISSKHYSKLFLITTAFCQLVVGNIPSSIMSLVTYLSINNQRTTPINNSIKYNSLLTGIITMVIILYLVCFYILIVITFN